MSQSTKRFSQVVLCIGLMVFASCSAGGGNVILPPFGPHGEFLFIVTSDEQTAGSYGVYAADQNIMSASNPSLYSDATATFYGGKVWVVNRLGQDNILEIDPANGFQPTANQFSTGAKSNPYNIAFVSLSKAYVSRYATTSVWIVNPSAGQKLGEIDLTPYADADGIPEMAYMTIVGNHLFIALQRLNRSTSPLWTPTDASYAVVVDTATDTIVDTNPAQPGANPIVLTGKNPVTPWQPYGGLLYIGDEGALGVLDGGIEKVNPTTLASEGYLVTETALGGEINDFVLGSTRGYVMTSDATCDVPPNYSPCNMHLKTFDSATGGNVQTVFDSNGFTLAKLTLSQDGSRLFVLDSTITAPGLRIFRTSDNTQLTNAPIPTGNLPPFWAVDFTLP